MDEAGEDEDDEVDDGEGDGELPVSRWGCMAAGDSSVTKD